MKKLTLSKNIEIYICKAYWAFRLSLIIETIYKKTKIIIESGSRPIICACVKKKIIFKRVGSQRIIFQIKKL